MFSFLNIQGLAPQTKESKVPYIQGHLDNKQLFMGLSETWLHNHLDAELTIDNFTLYRTDRNRQKKSNRGRHGGGVAIYLRNDLAATTNTLLTYSNGAVDIHAIYSKEENLVIATTYRQPDDSVHGRPSANNELKSALNALSQAILQLDVMPDILIGGDFNLPHTQWPECSPSLGSNKDERDMINTLSKFSNELLLTQIINQPTHYQGNTLDLVLTNNVDLIHDCEIQPTALSISHHHLVKVYTQYKSPQLPDSENTNPRLSPYDTLNFHSKDVDWENLSTALGNINWDSILENMSPDDMLEAIYKHTIAASKDHVPARMQNRKNTSKHKTIVNNLARKRRRINKQYQRITSPARKTKLYQELIQIEVKLQRLQKQSCEYQEKKACEAIKENSKFFFNYANKMRKIRSSVGPLLDPTTNQMTTDSAKMAEILVDQYSSVFSTPSSDPPNIINSNNSDRILSDVVITAEEMEASINELRPSAAAGPDGFPAILLKKCKQVLAGPLTLLWNKSMETSHIPKSLKLNLVTPNYKGGSKSTPANYRPVALTSHLIKLYEKVLRKKLATFLESNKCLNKNQHGFRSGRSCLTQLLAHHDQIISLLEDGQNVDVIYLDFAKAFDKVDHNIVLNKARSLGIQGSLLRWIQEFLQERSQCVVVNGKISSHRDVISGVPQGSVLGPLIFLILISDIDNDILLSEVASFADDTRVMRGISTEMDAAELQNDLFKIYQWSIDNNMEFNSLKFELLRYGKNNELKEATSYVSPSWDTVPEKHHVRDLGVTMSADCTFKSHINNIIEKAKQTSSWILRTFRTRELTAMITLYKSLVRPILEYASVLWAPIAKGEIQRLEEIQQSFLRKIKGINNNYHTALNDLNLYSLERRRERYIVIQVWKMLENINPNLRNTHSSSINLQSLPHDRRGRFCVVQHLATTPNHLQKVKQQSVKCFGVKLFNSLPKYIRNITNTSIDTFKFKLDKFLQHVEDMPLLRSGARNGRYSNHLFDHHHLTSLNDLEQTILGASNSTPVGDNANLLRRLPAEELTISRT